MKPKLSVFIISFNAERKIEACLKSIQWVDEIIVVDSESTDKTSELVKAYNGKFSSRPFINFSDQKNHAMHLCNGDWLLSIDCDEIVTDALREEIQCLISDSSSHDAYRIQRRSVIFGKEFRFSGTQDDRPVRLLRKEKGKFEQPIHEVLIVQGRVENLQSPLLHLTYDNISEYFTRFNRYTTCEAEYLLQKSCPLSWIDYFVRPGALFFKLYIVKQGFRDGFQGFLFCLFSAWYVLVKYAKYNELTRATP